MAQRSTPSSRRSSSGPGGPYPRSPPPTARRRLARAGSSEEAASACTAHQADVVRHHVMELAGDPGCAPGRRGAGHVVVPLPIPPARPGFPPPGRWPAGSGRPPPPPRHPGWSGADTTASYGWVWPGGHLGLDAADHHRTMTTRRTAGRQVGPSRIERDGVGQRERGVREGELVVQDARDPGHDEDRERPSSAPTRAARTGR